MCVLWVSFIVRFFYILKSHNPRFTPPPTLRANKHFTRPAFTSHHGAITHVFLTTDVGGAPPRFRADSAPARWNVRLVQSGVRSLQLQLRPIKEECLPCRHWGRQKSLSRGRSTETPTRPSSNRGWPPRHPKTPPSNPEASYPRADPPTPHGGGIRRIASCA